MSIRPSRRERQVVVDLGRASQIEDHRVGGDEVPDVRTQPDHAVDRPGAVEQPVGVDPDQIAVTPGLHRGPLRRRGGNDLVGTRRRFADLGRERQFHGGSGLAGDARDDGRGLDAVGHVMDEVDQQRDGQEGIGDARQHRDRRDEVAVLRRTDRAQHHQAVGEDADEGAEHDLGRPVAHEVAQHARRVLAGRQRQRHHGDREDHAGDRHHRGRDGRQHRARAGGVGAEQARPALPQESVAPAVRFDQGHRRDDRAQHDHRRHEPQARPQVRPPGSQAIQHGVLRSRGCARRMRAMAHKVVGVTRFERATLWSQTRCATRLRYTPKLRILPVPATAAAAPRPCTGGCAARTRTSAPSRSARPTPPVRPAARTWRPAGWSGARRRA